MLRLQHWLQQAEYKGGQWYCLKLDISKYFYRVSHRILKKLLAKKIKDVRLMEVLSAIIDCDHTPFGLPVGADPGDIPMDERLYDVGMPIGNLMSQVFANLYLDALDQYCKRELRIRYYIRYMDDIIILCDDKAMLRNWKDIIEKFLLEKLELNLNKKTCIRPVSQGIEFVGYRVWHDRRLLRRSTSLRIKRALKGVRMRYNRYELTMEEALDTLQCYLGMMGHCDCDALRRSVIESFVLTHEGSPVCGKKVRQEV
jgi:hypothetical protein